MDTTALLLSRLQFAFTVSFHIIFPSFTIGLAAWLTVLEALHLWTKRPAYRLVFEFWLKIFGIAFGLGVVSGVVMAFQFGANWSVLARMSGPIQGPLLAYETFTAFALEASFFGVLVFGRSRVPPAFYLFSTAMVALGTTLSAFWILVNNSWMQDPVGYVVQNGEFIPDDWAKIILSPVLLGAFPAYAAGVIPHRGSLCRGERCLVPAAPAGLSRNAKAKSATPPIARSPISQSDYWRSWSLCLPLRYLKSFRSCGDGSSGPTCLYSPHLASLPRSPPPGVFVNAETTCRSPWSR